MVKIIEIIAYQVLCEWFCKTVFGVYLLHLHNIVGNILHNKMVAMCHGFPIQGAVVGPR